MALELFSIIFESRVNEISEISLMLFSTRPTNMPLILELVDIT